jgi:hypothetical protein
LSSADLEDEPVFFFFSNRFGCLKSVLVSLALSLLLLVLLGWIRL